MSDHPGSRGAPTEESGLQATVASTGDMMVPGYAERVAADVTAQAMRPLLDVALAALPAADAPQP